MKKFVIVILALFVLLAGCPAVAECAAGGYNWTGSYAGLNLGFTLNDSQQSIGPTQANVVPPAYVQDLSDSSDLGSGAFAGGGQIGFNYQVNRFVFGIETDFDYNGTDDSHYANRQSLFAFAEAPGVAGGPVGAPPYARLNFINNVTQKIDYFGTLRGRVGYTPVDRLLVYATGGFAYGHVSSNSDALIKLSIPFGAAPQAGDQIVEKALFAGSSSGDQPGWTVGGGVEYALSRRWSVKAEYLFVDLGSQTYIARTSLDPLGFTARVDSSEHVVRAGINYRF